MRHIALGCTSESHTLYGVFMEKLSACIFKIDSGDYKNLLAAKKGELRASALNLPSDDAVQKSVKKKEVMRHCRRRTRGVCVASQKSVDELILLFTGCTDRCSVLSADIIKIWNEQKRHLEYIQDPPNISLYSKTGEITKGRVKFPVYRCARGSTSLESLHHRLANLIPGNSANFVNFQAYFLVDLSLWNALRKPFNRLAPQNRHTRELIGIEYL